MNFRTHRNTLSLTRRITASLLLALLAGAQAHADDHGERGFFDRFKGEQHKQDGKAVLQSAPLPKYQQECASCHMAYPAALLPVASWQHLMANLNKHFGTDASLAAADASQIGDWLAAHGGTYKRVSGMPPQDRISQSDWFLRKHRAGEVPASAWSRASVRSAANCVACHAGAEQGNFNERQVRIPG